MHAGTCYGRVPIPTGVVMSILTPAYTLQDWRVSFKDPNILFLLLLLSILLILAVNREARGVQAATGGWSENISRKLCEKVRRTRQVVETLNEKL